MVLSVPSSIMKEEKSDTLLQRIIFPRSRSHFVKMNSFKQGLNLIRFLESLSTSLKTMIFIILEILQADIYGKGLFRWCVRLMHAHMWAHLVGGSWVVFIFTLSDRTPCPPLVLHPPRLSLS